MPRAPGAFGPESRTVNFRRCWPHASGFARTPHHRRAAVDVADRASLQLIEAGGAGGWAEIDLYSSYNVAW